MPDSPLAVIVLAAGEGTRMRSPNTPKVLHGFAGRSLLGHVLAARRPLEAAHTVVVVGHRRDEVIDHLAEIAPSAVAVVQDEQHGTGHAVRVGLEAVPADATGTVRGGAWRRPVAHHADACGHSSRRIATLRPPC